LLFGDHSFFIKAGEVMMAARDAVIRVFQGEKPKEKDFMDIGKWSEEKWL